MLLVSAALYWSCAAAGPYVKRRAVQQTGRADMVSLVVILAKRVAETAPDAAG